MAGESQTSFSLSVRTFSFARQLDLAFYMKDLKGMHSEMNGLVQCPNCHALFTKNRLVLSLPVPVLKYLEKYVRTTRKGALKPLHEVFDLLVDASVDGPHPTAIIPYIGLFTLVTLDPTTSARNTMTTPHLPGLSIIHNNKFEEVPANTSAPAKNVARIFDSLDIEEDTPFNLGILPLVPGVSAFEEKRYWRIPVFAGAIFAALMGRLINDSFECEEIVLARRIVAHLTLKNSDGRQFKRKNASGPSAEKGKIKARRVAGLGTAPRRLRHCIHHAHSQCLSDSLILSRLPHQLASLMMKRQQ